MPRAFALFWLAGLLAAQSDLSALLTAVERRYNRARTIQLHFEQTESGAGRLTRTERGVVYFQKPGRMRWEYQQPPGKLFLTDGKFAWFFSPHSNRVEKSRMKESEDLRAPLAFLVGRLDFMRDFKEFRTYPEGPDIYIVAAPRSQRAPYSQVAFRVNPQRQITLLRVNAEDSSIMVYRLSDEVLNPALSPRLFTFTPPAGAELLEEVTP